MKERHSDPIAMDAGRSIPAGAEESMEYIFHVF
jgi:hypothetical protein